MELEAADPVAHVQFAPADIEGGEQAEIERMRDDAPVFRIQSFDLDVVRHTRFVLRDFDSLLGPEAIDAVVPRRSADHPSIEHREQRN